MWRFSMFQVRTCTQKCLMIKWCSEGILPTSCVKLIPSTNALLRALYGCIESALLWYKLYVETLRGMGFQVNPYDRCVANKIIKGKPYTICWYVDDNKVSHEDGEVVTWILRRNLEAFW
mmetsp:Transcript_17995/g.23319  ORF Transcript_17995/g.23319 Transcript_17995/m.23319 type:complete len:119 (+) Transcript_17995:695-1051(+)